MHRARIGVALGVVLALVAGSTAAHALWSARVPLSVSSVTTGDLAVTALWEPAPTWGQLFPGTATPASRLQVTATGAGDTLRWRLVLTRRVAPEFESHVALRAWVGACGTGVPLTAAGYSPGSGLTLGQTVSVCVQLALAPNAPASLMGRPIDAVITVRAEQRGAV